MLSKENKLQKPVYPLYAYFGVLRMVCEHDYVQEGYGTSFNGMVIWGKELRGTE